MKITAPEIPQIHIDFANAVAKAAQAHNMDKFTLTYRPDFNNRLDLDNSIGGEMKIIYRASDGRGRPANNLFIHLEATMRVDIIHTPSSSS